MKIRLSLIAIMLIAAGISVAMLWVNYEKQEETVVFSTNAARALKESIPNINMTYVHQVKPRTTTAQMLILNGWTFHNASSIDLFIISLDKDVAVTVLAHEYKNEGNAVIGVEQFFYGAMSFEKKQVLTYSEKYPFPNSSSYWSIKEGSLTSEGVIFIYDNKDEIVGATILIGVFMFIFSFAVGVSGFEKIRETKRILEDKSDRRI